MAKVELIGLEKEFGALTVINGVSFDVEDGEFVVLVGPSGCGKSTLLRMIAGLEAVSAGEMRIDGRTVNDLTPRQRDISMVFQSYALFPHMTVADNIGFGLKLAKMPRAERRAKVRAAADMLGLTDYLDRKPKQLSGGQRQRVAMGRAMVRNPKVFLFDEPLSNLDAKLRVAMRSEIKSLHKELGATIVYVTHDQIEAMTMADRVVVLNGGRIEQVGAPQELYRAPANRFVASFIGSPAMNMIEGEIAQDDDATMFCTGDIRVPLPAAPHLAKVPVTLGIRPEHITVDNAGPVQAHIVQVEPTGPRTILTTDAMGTRLVAEVDDTSSYRPGQQVRLAFREGGIHLFDKADGQALSLIRKEAAE